MKIGIACGGTGGHIFPGLATAEVLRARGLEVVLWMGGKDIEKKALGDWTGPVITVPSRGLPPRPGIKYIGAFLANWRAFLRCRRQMRFSPPAVFLAMGGYASVAPVMAAVSLSIPVVLHEANVIPGKANRFLSRWARVFALGFEETRNHIRHRNIIYTGIPLRRTNAEKLPTDGSAGVSTARDSERRQTEWNILKTDVFTIMAMGGSRGARTLNEIVAKAVVSLHAKGKNVQIIHLTGVEDEISVRKKYLDNGVTHLVFAFLSNMDQAYGKTSLAICRAGGSTCAELAKFGVPALLIPYPHAASNHQLANARAVENSGAADVIEEKHCAAEWLETYIFALMTDIAKLQRMKNAALERADRDAASALADLTLSIARRN